MSGWVAGAVVVGGVAGAAISANAAQGAANTQANAATNAADASLQATNNSNALQWQMYQQQMANQSPYMAGGQEGYSALLGAMGLGAPQAAGTPQGPVDANGNPISQAVGGGASGYSTTGTSQGFGPGGPTMTPGAGTSGAPLGTAVPAPGTASTQQVQNGSNLTTAGTAGVTANNPTTVSGAPGSSGSSGVNIPGIGNVGVTNYGASQGQLNSANSAYQGALSGTFNNADLNAQLAPNYEFQLQQGEQALEASMAATGTLQTGQGLKNISDYAQNSASGAYQQAFNNWNTQQNNLYTRLQGVITPGSSAGSAANSAASNAGSGIAQTTMQGTSNANNYLTGAAAANAAGQVGVANAVSGGIGSAVNGYMGANIYTKFMNTPANPQTGLSYNPGAGYGQYSNSPAPAYTDPTITP